MTTMSPCRRVGMHFVDIEAEAVAVYRAIDELWSLDAIMPQGGKEGHGRPTATRHLGRQALASRAPTTQWRHVGLVDEDQAGRIEAILVGHPLPLPSATSGRSRSLAISVFFVTELLLVDECPDSQR
jgi:hypothetical protein